MWCSACRQKLHRGECFTTVLDNNSDETIDKMIQEIITNTLTHKCPKCNTKHYREDGCNHITCPKCETHSCYICGKEISGIFVYQHYETTKCKLYGNSNNIPTLIEELGKFISRNPENSTEIYERLKINCKSDKLLLSKIRSLKSRYNIKNTTDNLCFIS